MKHWINLLDIETSKISKQYIKMQNVKLSDITGVRKFKISSLNEYIFLKTRNHLVNLKYVQRLFRFKTMFYLLNTIYPNNQRRIYFKTFVKYLQAVYLMNSMRKRVVLSKG